MRHIRKLLFGFVNLLGYPAFGFAQGIAIVVYTKQSSHVHVARRTKKISIQRARPTPRTMWLPIRAPVIFRW